MRKRFLCFLILLAFLSIPAFAANVKLDGIVNVLKEYNATTATLQIPANESNNNLTFAYLHWAVSPADYSVYLGLQYGCSDHTLEDGLTGVEVRVNDALIGTVYADGTMTSVDHDRYEMESVFYVSDKIPYEVTCEIRVGIKFWPDEDIVAGVRILDFGGNPSNNYEQTVYSPYTTTTKPSAFASTRKTTTEKSTAFRTTTAKTTKTEPTTIKIAAEMSTEAAPYTARTTAPVIRAAPKREPTATTGATVLQPTVLQPVAVSPEPEVTQQINGIKTAKPKTTNEKTTKTTQAKTSASDTTTEPAARITTSAETEPAASLTVVGDMSNAQMYKEVNKVKIVGIVLVVVILTAAIMSALFLGMRQKQNPAEARTPQEEYEDFG